MINQQKRRFITEDLNVQQESGEDLKYGSTREVGVKVPRMNEAGAESSLIPGCGVSTTQCWFCTTR